MTSSDYARLRDDVRNALYQEVPGFESIQTVADLERLCALAVRNRAAESTGLFRWEFEEELEESGFAALYGPRTDDGLQDELDVARNLEE